MCGCDLVVDSVLNKPINVESSKHSFTYTDKHGVRHTLIPEFNMEVEINYAAVYKIQDMYGVDKGYIFIVGNKQETNDN